MDIYIYIQAADLKLVICSLVGYQFCRLQINNFVLRVTEDEGKRGDSQCASLVFAGCVSGLRIAIWIVFR